MIWAIVTLALFLLSACAWTRVLGAKTLSESVVYAFVVLGAAILGAGYVLARFNQLNLIESWTLAGGAAGAGSLLLELWSRNWQLSWNMGLPRFHLAEWRREFEHAPRTAQISLLGMSAAVLILGLVNLGVLLVTPPHNWDSLTYHLPRMAYYMQFGNLGVFDADYYPQVIFAKGSTLFLIFTYLTSGRNENLLQVVQFSSYAVSLIVLYGIGRTMKLGRMASLGGALLFGLLVEVLMEATTTQNDLVLTAFAGCGVYLLLRFSEEPQRKYLYLAIVAFAVALAVKNTFLLLVPSLSILVGYVLWKTRGFLRGAMMGDGARLGLVSVVALCVIVMPAGYWDNWRMYGNPLGPRNVLDLESAADEGWQQNLETGVKNLFRIGLDFVSLDGLPPIQPVVQAQRILRALPVFLAERSGLDLENQPEYSDIGYVQEGARAFTYDRLPHAQEDDSFWGVGGFLLLLPLTILVLVGVAGGSVVRVLALMGLVALVTLAFALDYETWHGRRVITMAFFCAPCFAWTLERLWQSRGNGSPRGQRGRQLARGYVTGALGLTCLVALSAVFFREPNSLYPRDPSSLWAVGNISLRDGALQTDRLGLMMAARTDYLEAVRRFDEAVPENAVVATDLYGNSFEFPLFGKGLTRTILPLNSFWRGTQPIPPQAQYLLLESPGRPDTQGFVLLGKDWYLRKLK